MREGVRIYLERDVGQADGEREQERMTMPTAATMQGTKVWITAAQTSVEENRLAAILQPLSRWRLKSECD